MQAFQQAPDDPALDPFSDAAVFPDEFAGADVIDLVKFLLLKFQIDQLREYFSVCGVKHSLTFGFLLNCGFSVSPLI